MGAGVTRSPDLIVGTWGKASKTLLLCGVILMSVVQLVLAAVQVVYAKRWSWYWLIIGPVTGLSTLWTAIELLIQYFTRNKPVRWYYGIHPGVLFAIQFSLMTGQITSASFVMESGSDVCSPYWEKVCSAPRLEVAVGSLACTIGLFHALLAVRSCVEIHRLRIGKSRATPIAPESDPTLDVEDRPGGDPPELPNDEKKTPPAAPVIVPVEVEGGAGTANLFVVDGPDGRPQLLVPVGMNLRAVQADDGQPRQVMVSAEAASRPMYELPPEVRGNELYAGQRAEMHGVSRLV